MKGARTIVLLGVVLLAAAVASVGFAKRPLKDFSPPEGFIPPPLNLLESNFRQRSWHRGSTRCSQSVH